MSLAAGKLRHYMSLQRPVRVQDPESGEIISTWEEVAKVWAAIEPVSAREFVQSSALQSNVTTRIQVRYRADVRASWRLVHIAKLQVYDIAGVLTDKDSGLEYITMPCSQGVNDGG